MSVTENGARLAARELAEAVREGLEGRRWPSPRSPLEVPDPPCAPSPRPALLPFSNPLGLGAHAKPGPLNRPVRFIRRAVKAFLRPWLDVQTRFNHGVIDALEQSQAAAHDHLRRLSDHLRQQEARVRKVTDRLDEFRFARARAVCDLAPVAVTLRLLEQTFVQTRMPRTPARVLDLARGEGPCAADLSDLGYQVVSVDLGRLSGGALPFADGSFDAAVCVAALEPGADTDGVAAAEVYRLLRSGGRLILTAPHDRDRLDQLLARFRRPETAFGVRDGAGWTFTTEEAAGAVALVVAERA
jgi:SAM-dependent methyltransferase